jgi:four helix bundle protein
MAKIERFEDLHSWQKARQLTNLIYDLTEHPKFSKDFRLSGQIQDATGSVMHNIAEGFDSGTNPEFIRFLKIARRSASEVQSELYLALDWISAKIQTANYKTTQLKNYETITLR